MTIRRQLVAHRKSMTGRKQLIAESCKLIGKA
jgi:hypothetical protein